MSKLGIALGGGGARGLAHIGVLKVLERENIPIHAITGCSMGSVVGGLYAYLQNAQDVENYIFDILSNPVVKELDFENLSENKKNEDGLVDKITEFIQNRVAALRAINDISIISEETTKKIFSLLPNPKIENLPIKFSAISTNLINGEEVNFTKGNLRKVIMASSAIPGIFPPVKIGSSLFIDGNTAESVPVGKVRELGADRVIAVDVTRDIKIASPINNAIEVVFRAQDISTFHLSNERLKSADLILKPNVKSLSWADFAYAKKIIKAGEKETEKMLPKIKELIDKNYYLLEFEHFLSKFKD